MRTMPIALVGIILSGCAGQPRTVERLTTLVCPATEPALVCDGWRPDYRPVNVHELQELFLERGEGLDCRDTLLALWSQLRAECLDEADRQRQGHEDDP